MDREKVSVTIITFNEELNIRACLESVQWADEIVVVDCGSTDKTVAICREYTDRVFYNPWPGHKEQKNFAVSQAAHLWILSLDADERATDELRAFVLAELSHPEHDGYLFPRKNYFLGRWIKYGGWYPDQVLRLFRRDRGAFGGENPHDKVIIETGHIAQTNVPLLHYTYRSISHYAEKINSYTDIMARERFRSGASGRAAIVLAPIKVITKFFEVYVFKRSFLDGIPGLIIAVVSAYATFLRYAKVWEISRIHHRQTDHSA
jgi:glycosyltransferase involved in cell wall biosynthesis